MTESHVHEPGKVFLMAVLSTVLFAFMALAVKFSAESGVHITQIILFRSLLALPVVLLLISRHHQSQTLLHTKRPLAHVARGVVGIAAMAFTFLSFKLLPMGDATTLQFASPIILTALSVPFLGEKVGPWRWGAVGLGLIGIIITAAPSGDVNVVGSAIALMAAFLAAVAAILIRKMGETENSLTIVFYFTVSGIVISMVLCPFFWQPIDNVWVFYALLMVGILGGTGQFFLTMAYSQAPAAYVSVFSYVSIFFSIGFDALFWAHYPDWNIWIGSAIIIVSGLVILYREVVHKGRVAKLSTFGLAPVRPTIKDKMDAGLAANDDVWKNDLSDNHKANKDIKP